MTDNSNILALMMQNDLCLKEGQSYYITNHLVLNPNSIDLKADEVLFIIKIKIIATDDFILDYHSATESRKIDEVIIQPEIIEKDIVTRHKGSIYFRISNNDDFEVSYVKLKIVDE